MFMGGLIMTSNFDDGDSVGRGRNRPCKSGLDSDAATRRDRMREPVKIRFRLLGPRLTGRFTAYVGRRRPRPLSISSQKGRALLAYLAMQPEHFARREDLANLFWGDRVDEYARHKPVPRHPT